jgi:hypothetical protein
MTICTDYWRDIPGFGGRYAASRSGEIRSSNRKVRPILLHPKCGTNNRLYVCIRPDLSVKAKMFSAHALVLLAFSGPCPAGKVVRHLDGNPRNNHLTNLAYGTMAENAHDKVGHGTNNWGARNGGARLTEADVRSLRRLSAEGISGRELARRYKISPPHVSGIINGRFWRNLLPKIPTGVRICPTCGKPLDHPRSVRPC